MAEAVARVFGGSIALVLGGRQSLLKRVPWQSQETRSSRAKKREATRRIRRTRKRLYQVWVIRLCSDFES
ncbi:MAG: hypothetical protein ACLFSH_13520, partial [Phormidium sp.]